MSLTVTQLGSDVGTIDTLRALELSFYTMSSITSIVRGHHDAYCALASHLSASITTQKSPHVLGARVPISTIVKCAIILRGTDTHDLSIADTMSQI